MRGSGFAGKQCVCVHGIVWGGLGGGISGVCVCVRLVCTVEEISEIHTRSVHAKSNSD